MEALLRAVLPRFVPGLSFEVFPFLSKDDLLKKLPQRLRGYSGWFPDDRCVLVVVDRDDDDCLKLKAHLESCAREAGLATRSTAKKRGRVQVINRIAIEELEAWYFGDWDAVRAAYPRVSASTPRKAEYRRPDAIKGGTWEAFERVLQSAGYFSTGLRKIEAARAIGPHLVAARSSSPSFCALRDALLELI